MAKKSDICRNSYQGFNCVQFKFSVGIAMYTRLGKVIQKEQIKPKLLMLAFSAETLQFVAFMTTALFALLSNSVLNLLLST